MREAEERSDATTMPSSSSSSLSSFRGKEKKTDLDHRLERQARQRRRPRRGQTPQGLELGGSGRVAGLSLEVHAKFFSFAGVREKEKKKKRTRKKKRGGKKKLCVSERVVSLSLLPFPLSTSSSRQSLFLSAASSLPYSYKSPRCVCPRLLLRERCLVRRVRVFGGELREEEGIESNKRERESIAAAAAPS